MDARERREMRQAQALGRALRMMRGLTPRPRSERATLQLGARVEVPSRTCPVGRVVTAQEAERAICSLRCFQVGEWALDTSTVESNPIAIELFRAHTETSRAFRANVVRVARFSGAMLGLRSIVIEWSGRARPTRTTIARAIAAPPGLDRRGKDHFTRWYAEHAIPRRAGRA